MAPELHRYVRRVEGEVLIMSKATTVSGQGHTQKIEMNQWIPFLAAFTLENRGAHARVDVLGETVGYQVETEDRPFDGIDADVKDRERTVWIHFGATPSDHLSHGVHSATAIWVVSATEDAGPALEIEAEDGTKTVLQLTRQDAFALPPPER
jgi:hypothetical protein